MTSAEAPDIERIDMQSGTYGEGEPCCACGKPSSGTHGLPTYNGDVVSNDWPLDWGSKPCCQACYEAHASGRMPCADNDYNHLVNSARWLHCHGSGI